VQLFALDVDGLPVNFTRAEIRLVFDGRRIPVQWSRGSNEYIADVPADFSALPGRYDLVVSASNAWGGIGPATSCELLRQAITVNERLNGTWIFIGAGISAVFVVGALAIVLRRRHAQVEAVMAMIFTEVTGIETA
jgi:hypothetical protein